MYGTDITREYTRDSFQSSSPENVAQCETPGRSAFFSSIEKFSNNFVCGYIFYSRIILLLVCPLRSNFIGQFTKCVKQSWSSTIWSSNKLLVCICWGCVYVCGCIYFNVGKICGNRMKINKFLEGRVSHRIQQKREHRICSKHFAKHAHFCT